MNDLDFQRLMANLCTAREILASVKLEKLELRQERMLPLQEWTLYSQLQKLGEEWEEVRGAYDGLSGASQTVLEGHGLKLHTLCRIKAQELLREVADVSNVLDSLTWLLIETGLLEEVAGQ